MKLMLLVASNVPAFFAQFELVSLAGWLFVVSFFFSILHMMFNLMPNCLRSKQYTLRIDASMLSFTWGNFKNYYLYVPLVRSKNREKKESLFLTYSMRHADLAICAMYVIGRLHPAL